MSFYVAVFRGGGRGDLLYSYPTLAGIRETLGIMPLRHDESVIVYEFDSTDSEGKPVDPLKWRWA